MLVPVSYSGGTITMRKALTTDDKWRVLAVSAYDVTAGNQGVAIFHGVVRCRYEGTAPAMGEVMEMSATTDGQLEQQSGTVGAQPGPNGLAVVIHPPSSSLVWVNLRR